MEPHQAARCSCRRAQEVCSHAGPLRALVGCMWTTVTVVHLHGRVVLSSTGCLVSAFSELVAPGLRALLGEGAKKTINFAVVCAMKLWQKHIMGAPVVFYIDNNSARDVAISGSGRAEVPKALLEQLLFREQQSQAW